MMPFHYIYKILFVVNIRKAFGAIMPGLDIKDMKVISPSPDNFILELEVSGLNIDGIKKFNYIASGEHIYENGNSTVDSKLLRDHVAHSNIFKLSDNTLVTAYSLFDINDMAITTDDEDTIDNLLLMPNANIEPSDRADNPIPFHVINSNSVYGYDKTKRCKSFGFPEYDDNDRRFKMSTHNKNAKGFNDNDPLGKTDTMSLYRYRKAATTISSILGLGHQADVAGVENGFDKLFVFDPTNDNLAQFTTSNLHEWEYPQSNRSQGGLGVSNNFDKGTLLIRSILFPKQTLTNEYSTERTYSDISGKPFENVRKYRFDDSYFYSNGTHIILNHKDESRFKFSGTPPVIPNQKTYNVGGTMITSNYSRRFGDSVGKEHRSPIPPDSEDCLMVLDDNRSEKMADDYNTYGTFNVEQSDISSKTGMFNQFTPELLNRENETLSDTSLMTSQHKANIFDIEFVRDFWRDIKDSFKTAQDKDNPAYKEIQTNLKNSIRRNLFKLVEEIKPVHTELYKVTFDNDEEEG